ncbi:MULTISPECIES: hypothetical protein [Mycobacterium]|uniref:Uncharacterized protein n=1 Tax=Mycobacterium kiyosense TaxID=2871094 RepID=A0A9P3UUH4_9MYCO|nr:MULTISPECIES: hypothetical protein [Mycobacterium]BDB39703.1 hypothetical protein IWGMT90018_01490 [Mycobacterium kiyosense]BDE11559.1 hypothetical protein MKCMC460_04190 [Mycobacterium sp. 20KCMC460]GLB82357.1 hypothetical protein SRL2020028_16130 [Mycobacterium kiyosense]GLB88936.1 hypothetical protein SRL2020130_17530 [Mycobacterium kiyosense]GLB95572.1 hypothetical protein SRL2020226_23480 [Mycobacterium kiyosense]
MVALPRGICVDVTAFTVLPVHLPGYAVGDEFAGAKRSDSPHERNRSRANGLALVHIELFATAPDFHLTAASSAAESSTNGPARYCAVVGPSRAQ